MANTATTLMVATGLSVMNCKPDTAGLRELGLVDAAELPPAAAVDVGVAVSDCVPPSKLVPAELKLKTVLLCVPCGVALALLPLAEYPPPDGAGIVV